MNRNNNFNNDPMNMNNNYNNNHMDNNYNNNYNNDQYNFNYNPNSNYNPNPYSEKNNQDLLLAVFLTFIFGFLGSIFAIMKYGQSKGKNRETMANFLNFYYSFPINLTLIYILMFICGIGALQIKLLYIPFYVLFLSFFIYLIIYFVNFIRIIIKAFKSGHIDKMPFSYNLFKY